MRGEMRRMEWKIPLARPCTATEEIKAVVEVLESGCLSLGPRLDEFERRFANLIGTRYAVGVNSGTSGLHLCIKALGIKEGDEVITSPFSFIASANSILYENARPVFVDIEEESFNMDPGKITEKVTKNTKAILVVHVFGQSCDMDPIMKIAKKFGLAVIEDACESINATYKGRKVGSFGQAAVFAFYPNKQMTTGEGGMIVTDNEEIYNLCKSYANQGRGKDMQWLLHERIGYNYRLSEISSALGIAQLDKLDSLIKRRREIARAYMEELQGTRGIVLPKIREHNEHTWFIFPIRIIGLDRNRIIAELGKRGIASKAYFYPCIHLQPFYIEKFGYRGGDFPVSEKISNQTIVLPLYPQMGETEIKFVTGALKTIMEEEA